MSKFFDDGLSEIIHHSCSISNIALKIKDHYLKKGLSDDELELLKKISNLGIQMSIICLGYLLEEAGVKSDDE